MDYCNKCGGDPDEVGELTEWRTMNVCKSCLVNEPDYALFLEEVNEALRAEVERLTAERDALARRMRVVEMHVVACRRSDGTYWLDYPSGRIAFVICVLNDDARARGYWPTASAALDAAADALEKAELMEVGNV